MKHRVVFWDRPAHHCDVPDKLASNAYVVRSPWARNSLLIIFSHDTLFRLQTTQEKADSRKGRGISPYAEFHQLVGDCVSKSQPEPVGAKQMRPPLPSKAYFRSTSDGKINRINYEFLHSAGGSPVDSYDYLRPPRSESTSASQSPVPQKAGQEGPPPPPPQTTVLSGSPRDRRSSSMDHLCGSPSGLKHRRIYEELSPRDADDGDTYVYMAPLKDFPEAAAAQQLEQAAANSPKTNAISSVDGSGSTALDSSSELRSVHGSSSCSLGLFDGIMLFLCLLVGLIEDT